MCEPILEQPMEDVSFGQLLLRLFTTAERFNMEVQPQLLLLQKTLLSIEGLGRQLYPKLDIWVSAKPFMERWIREQHGFKNLLNILKEDGYDTTVQLLKMPKLIYSLLERSHERIRSPSKAFMNEHFRIHKQIRRRFFIYGAATFMLILSVVNTFLHPGWFPGVNIWWPWIVSAALFLIGKSFPIRR